MSVGVNTSERKARAAGAAKVGVGGRCGSARRVAHGPGRGDFLAVVTCLNWNLCSTAFFHFFPGGSRTLVCMALVLTVSVQPSGWGGGSGLLGVLEWGAQPGTGLRGNRPNMNIVFKTLRRNFGPRHKRWEGNNIWSVGEKDGLWEGSCTIFSPTERHPSKLFPVQSTHSVISKRISLNQSYSELQQFEKLNASFQNLKWFSFGGIETNRSYSVPQ